MYLGGGMRTKNPAGRWLVVFACVAGAGIGLRAIDLAKTQDGVIAKAAKGDAPRVRLVALPAAGRPQPFPIDARLLREAVRDGELQVALPDGTTQRVAIERNYTDSTGHWNVIGRAPTRLGKLPMVLTFGAGAVFGTMPAPDGGTMQVTTAPGGLVRINAPASGIDGERIAPGLDAQVPPGETDGLGEPQSAAIATHTREIQATLADQQIPVQKFAASAAPAEATPVQIDMVALYTQEQIALRGDAAAVETEFANLVAVANQAHIDSGSRARFNITRILAEADSVPASVDDQRALDNIYHSSALDSQRRDWGGDLIVMLRPENDDGMCGRSYAASAPLRRTATYGANGQVVINGGDTCGPFVFAHETGHVLGAFDDRGASTSPTGVLAQPSYHYAYGLRSYFFSTIMASPGGATRLPFFSNPESTACNGMPCGIVDYVDDVRAFNAMAPVVAAYRSAFGTLVIGDVEAMEPDYADNVVYVPVRYTGYEWNYPSYAVEVSGGTATRDVDYTVDFSSGVRVTIKPDAQIEGDETILLRIVPQDGVTLAKGEATLTIVDDDPRPVVSGRVVFPDGIAPPTTPVTFTFNDFDAPGHTMTLGAAPPGFTFEVRPFHGKQLFPKMVLPAPFALPRMATLVNEVRGSRDYVLMPQRGVRLWGRVLADIGDPDGLVLPTLTQLEATHYEGNDIWSENLAYVVNKGNQFSIYVPVGSNTTFRATAVPDYPSYKPGFLGMYDAADDRFEVVTLTPSLVSLNAWPAARTPTDTRGAPVHFSAELGNDVTFRCTTIDGTAKAGVDYVPMTAVMTVPWRTSGGIQYCGNLQVMPNNRRASLWFEVEITEVSGAVLHTSRARVVIPGIPVRTGGPAPATAPGA